MGTPEANSRYYYSEKGTTNRRRLQRAYNARRMRIYQDSIWWYKSLHPCVDCGETDPIVLEFDHVRGEKLKKVSTFQSRRSAWAEIQKCDVVCANDHARREWERRHGLRP